MKNYIQSDELQKQINWDAIMKMERCAGGHDEQMKGLFKNVDVIAHWNEGGWQGMVATCVRFNKGKFKGKYGIYNDYYGSCSGCDSWEGATDENVRVMCIGLSNGTYIFKTLDDVRTYLENPEKDSDWTSWSNVASNLLSNITFNLANKIKNDNDKPIN